MSAPTFEGALAFARDLIRIPSLPGREEGVARRVLQEMESLGFLDLRFDRVGNVLGRIPGRGEGPPLLLNSHLDIVSAGDPSGWEIPPFEGRVQDGFLHGRGAMDIKGPLALQTYAAARLAGESPGDLWVAHTVFEERGGWGMAALLESGDLPRPAAVLLGEATRGDIAIGHRGRAEIEVVLHGVAGHASVPGEASSALDLLPAVLDGVADLAARQREDSLLGPASVVATQIDVLPESRNVIPDQVIVTLDWRVLPGDRPEALVQRVEEALAPRLRRIGADRLRHRSVGVRVAREEQRSWTGISELRELFTPGFLVDPDHAAIRAAARAAGRRGREGEPAQVRPWAFATDGGWSAGVHGIPTLGFAPGLESFAHTNRERLDLEEARWAFEAMQRMIPAIQDALG